MNQKILRRDLILEKCGDKNHTKGCYIRFSNKEIAQCKPREDVIIDYDKDGEIVGIEFHEGL